MRKFLPLALAVLATGCATTHKDLDGRMTYETREAPRNVVHQDTVSTVDDILAARAADPTHPLSVSVVTTNRGGTTRVDVSSGYGYGVYGSSLPVLDPCNRIDPLTGISPCALESDALYRQSGYANRPLPTLGVRQDPALTERVEALEGDVDALARQVSGR